MRMTLEAMDISNETETTVDQISIPGITVIGNAKEGYIIACGRQRASQCKFTNRQEAIEYVSNMPWDVIAVVASEITKAELAFGQSKKRIDNGN